jgi:uncharacterized membrane protein
MKTSTVLIASAFATALSLGALTSAHAADMEKCYGVAKAGKNDCKAGSHSCAGSATKDRDPESFVVVPKGLCDKLAGGTHEPMMKK